MDVAVISKGDGFVWIKSRAVDKSMNVLEKALANKQ